VLARLAPAITAAVFLPIILIAALISALTAAFTTGGHTADTVSAPSNPSAVAQADIPAHMLALYRAAAATCPGLDWSTLAGIGKTETDHGRSNLPGVHSAANYAGAEGEMQFEPATFAEYAQPVPPGGANPPSPYDEVDAVYAAARLLCANGARNNQDLSHAILTYNHDQNYLHTVLDTAHRYSQTPPNLSVTCPTVQATVQPATEDFSNSPQWAAVRFACAQLGKPYVWGAAGPATFDCSGLTMTAYQQAGITIGRTTYEQATDGRPISDGELQPGDLIFYNGNEHVALYLGGGNAIHAPDTGDVVKIAPYRTIGTISEIRRIAG
jgi:cell wall-associated NlpC family hydrolase